MVGFCSLPLGDMCRLAELGMKAGAHIIELDSVAVATA